MAVRLHGPFGSWSLPQGACVLGRGKACDVRIDDPRLSRQHARFILKGHHLMVEDLGSRNGVLVDGMRIAGTASLRHGQVVTCGPVALTVAVDETRLHPRQAHGSQEPGTRRTGPRSDTEAMLMAIEAVPVAAPPEPAALTPTPAPVEVTVEMADPGPNASGAHGTSLQPAPAPGSQTSPLQALRDEPPGPRPPPPPLQHGTSRLLEAASAVDIDASALLPPDPTREEARARLLAGLVDGLAAAGVSAFGVATGLLVLAGALVQAGVAVVEGVPRVVRDGVAGFGEVLTAMLHPEGLLAAHRAAPAAAAADELSAVLLVLGAAMAAMTVVAGPLLVLVVPTVLLGAPAMHRRLGLVVVTARDSQPLGYARALLRWGAAIVLWPLAVPALLLRRRAPHDLVSGCIVRRRG